MAACWNQENLVNPQLVYNNSRDIYCIIYIYTYTDCILYIYDMCVCVFLVGGFNPSQPYARHRDQSSQVTPEQVSIWGVEKYSLKI